MLLLGGSSLGLYADKFVWILLFFDIFAEFSKTP